MADEMAQHLANHLETHLVIKMVQQLETEKEPVLADEMAQHLVHHLYLVEQMELQFSPSFPLLDLLFSLRRRIILFFAGAESRSSSRELSAIWCIAETCDNRARDARARIEKFILQLLLLVLNVCVFYNQTKFMRTDFAYGKHLAITVLLS